MVQISIGSIPVDESSCGLGVMTSPLHGEDQWFDSTLEYHFLIIFCNISFCFFLLQLVVTVGWMILHMLFTWHEEKCTNVCFACVLFSVLLFLYTTTT